MTVVEMTASRNDKFTGKERDAESGSGSTSVLHKWGTTMKESYSYDLVGNRHQRR